MIFEWYSGSDSENEVPRKLDCYSREAPDLSPAECAARLEELLRIERDTNWRGYICFYAGCAFLDADDSRGAHAWFAKALPLYDVLAANFRDVSAEYSRCLFFSLMDAHSRDGDESWIPLSLRTLAHLPAMSPTKEESMLVYSIAGDAINVLAKKLNSSELYGASVDLCAVAHHVAPECAAVLESLVYASYGAGDRATAARVFRVFTDLNPSYEYRERLEAFASEAL